MKKRDWIFYQVHGNVGNFLKGQAGLDLMGEVQFNVPQKTRSKIDNIVKEMRGIRHGDDSMPEDVEPSAKTILSIIEGVEHETARILLFCHYMKLRHYFDLDFDNETWEKTLVSASNLRDADMSHNIKKILCVILQEWQEVWFWNTDFSTVDHNDEEEEDD